MPPRTVILDLDGTLLDPRGRLSSRSLQALQALVAQDWLVCVATGRTLRSVERLLGEVGLNGPWFCCDGSQVFDAPRGGIVDERFLPAEVVATLLREAPPSLCALTFGKDGRAYRLFDERAAPLLARLPGIERVDALPREQVFKLTFICEEPARAALLEQLAARGLGRHSVELTRLGLFSGFRWWAVDAVADVRGKAAALDYLEETRGIAYNEVIAIGDGENDATLLEAAGLGVAVANAVETVREAADRVIGHHADDGVAQFLEELLGDAR